MLVGLLLLGCFLVKGRQFHAGAGRKLGERVLELQVLTLHHKLEDISALIALTKAAPCTRLGPDDEGRGLFIVVKRTKPGIVFARMAQFDTRLRDKIHDIYARFYFIDCGHIRISTS